MPNLYIHNREHRQAALSGSGTASLVAVFTESGHSTAASMRDAQDILRMIRGNEDWIECDCHREEGVGPLMSPRLLPTGQLTLVRHGRVQHADACPFHRMRENPCGTDTEVEAPSDALVARIESLLSCADTNAMPDRLVLAATELLVACGYDACPSADVLSSKALQVSHRDVNAHYGQTDRVAEVMLSTGHSLAEVMCTHLGSVGRMMNRWAASGVGQGLFFGVVNAIEDGALIRTPRSGPSVTWMSDRLTLRSPVVKGPFWVIARIDVERQVLTDAYAWPVVSGAHLMPVESEEERELGKVLLGQLAYWEGKGADYTLHKLIRADDVADGPAFRLSSSRRVIDVHRVLFPGRYQAMLAAVEAMHRASARAPADIDHVQFLINDEDLDTWRRQLTGAAMRP